MSGPEETCRIDVWLWRARFFKTRSLAARTIEESGVRLIRGAARAALDKPSRSVRIGDVLAFHQGARWICLRVEGFGEGRGPAVTARDLYSFIDAAPEGRSPERARSLGAAADRKP
jgi:ribosome-associated heat shock protein Hsp15